MFFKYKLIVTCIMRNGVSLDNINDKNSLLATVAKTMGL